MNGALVSVTSDTMKVANYSLREQVGYAVIRL